jgi:hypothetical protein
MRQALCDGATAELLRQRRLHVRAAGSRAVKGKGSMQVRGLGPRERGREREIIYLPDCVLPLPFNAALTL